MADPDRIITDMDELIVDPTLHAVHEAILREKTRRGTYMGPGRIGASAIGDDQRAVWLAWRWCLPYDQDDPRRFMIFELGDLLEDHVADLLRRAGMQVIVDDGKNQQFGFKAVGGHYAMRLDGVLLGVPEAPQTWHLLEVKSMADRYFKELIKKGVEKAEPKYHAQCITGMHHAGLTRCLFVVYNKNTSELYFERIKADEMHGAALLEKATTIATLPTPPDSGYPDRSWYQVKFKSEHWQAVYWGDELPPHPNCRNCRFGAPYLQDPEEKARWGCMRHHVELDYGRQKTGCTDHNWIPELVPAELVELREDLCAVHYRKHGHDFWNVPEQAASTNGPAFTSRELTQLSKVDFDPKATKDILSLGLREEMGARIEHVEPTKRKGDEVPASLHIPDDQLLAEQASLDAGDQPTTEK